MDCGNLHQKIADIAAEFVPDALFSLNVDSNFIVQDANLATFTKKISKHDAI